jgi:hypothetical protein
MSDDRFEEFLREAAEHYHVPPEVPREDMWIAIAEARRRSVRRTRRPDWRAWGIGIAAALAIGVGIGRISVGARPSVPVASAPTPAGEAPGIPVAYQVATADHLGRVEVFLTGFRADARSGRTGTDVAPDARDLLATTRLLLDSPVSDDFVLRDLLEDVELVLTQIAQYSGRPDSSELSLIDDSIDQRSVLFRLHSATDATPDGMPYQGAL